MIIRRAVPKSFDCFGKVFLLYPLTLKLDNIVATLAKHPILCRYCWIETPILEGRRWMLQCDKQSEAVRISSSLSYSYSFTYLFENPMQNCGFKEARLMRSEGNFNLKLRSSSQIKSDDTSRNAANILSDDVPSHQGISVGG